MDWISDPQTWIALATLTFLEIVLGVDNIIFISILSGKLPPADQPRARRLGLLGAMVTRVMLLFSLAYIIRLTKPWFVVWGTNISGRDLILILGGLFLLAKSERYYFDMDAIRERMGNEMSAEEYDLARRGWGEPETNEDGILTSHAGAGKHDGGRSHPAGRGKRSVWTIPTERVRLRSDLTPGQRAYVLGELIARGIL